MSSMNLPTSE